MRIRPLHDWALAPKEAVALQRELSGRVRVEDDLPPLRHVAGVDVGFDDGGRTTRAAAAVFSWPDLERVEDAVARRETTFPYVPGLLSFRELPALLEALESLRTDVQLLFCDGQGIAHPRRFGIACHLGLLVDRPAIGVGKSRLVGEAGEPGREKGARVALVDGGETVGHVVRTRTGVKPVYVSPGHRVSMGMAVDLVLAASPRYRLPEPIRQADRLASNRGEAPSRAGSVDVGGRRLVLRSASPRGFARECALRAAANNLRRPVGRLASEAASRRAAGGCRMPARSAGNRPAC
ncbi:MAG: deoxyribonuclease V [Halofilum sp. (in: g-proteobacteria)]|nr:deoxyribonuclease V [Halofilum sp. (in: g-proteobacteria)]